MDYVIILFWSIFGYGLGFSFQMMGIANSIEAKKMSNKKGELKPKYKRQVQTISFIVSVIFFIISYNAVM